MGRPSTAGHRGWCAAQANSGVQRSDPKGHGGVSPGGPQQDETLGPEGRSVGADAGLRDGAGPGPSPGIAPRPVWGTSREWIDSRIPCNLPALAPVQGGMAEGLITSTGSGAGHCDPFEERLAGALPKLRTHLVKRVGARSSIDAEDQLQHSVGDIARDLHMPLGTVKSHLSRARRRLAQLELHDRSRKESDHA